MKKFKTILLSVATLIVMLLMASCQEDCEKHNYGSVTVRNNAGFPILVDVTWGGSMYNDERYLSHGRSTTYNEVPSGSARVWGNAGYGWVSNSIYLSNCQNYTYTWHSTKDEEYNPNPNTLESNTESPITYYDINKWIKVND